MAMAHLALTFLFAVLLIPTTSAEFGAAKVHHVVGGDRGWDSSSDLSAWASTRTFTIGDEIWISYSAAGGAIAEVKSKEEYESCDTSNPIVMYTDGLQSIPLEKEGIRYFLSTEPHSCNNGLKLHVEVQPVTNSLSSSATAAAANVEAEGPSTPSASPLHNRVSSFLIMNVMFCVSMMFLHA